MAEYLCAEKVTHVIDATHPFASQMSVNAINACRETGTQLCALTRPAWDSVDGDQWHRVPTIGAAAEYLHQCAFAACSPLGVSFFTRIDRLCST